MNKLIKTLVVGAVLAGMTSQTSMAINKEWSAVAGFVGGLLVANVANSAPSYDPPRYYHQSNWYWQESRPDYGYERCPPARVEYETVREWVPGRWEWRYSHCGSRTQVWVPGYWTTTRRTAWVD